MPGHSGTHVQIPDTSRTNSVPSEVRGVRAIARYLGKSRSAAGRALLRGDYPAVQHGRTWVLVPALIPAHAVALAALQAAARSGSGHSHPGAAPGEGGVVPAAEPPGLSPSSDEKKGGK